jgi:predicted transcriptional regulator
MNEALATLLDGRTFAVDATTPIADVRRIFLEERVPAIVVLSSRDRLYGIITRTDVLAANENARAFDVMSGFVVSLPETATVKNAASLIAFEGVGQVVVTDREGRVTGVVSAVDLLRAITG